MERKNIYEIKKLESPPRIVKLFSEQEINSIIKLYASLPVTLYNKKQNIIKRRWIQNYNKSLDEIYTSKLREVLGEYKMDNLKSDKGEDFLGLFHESFSPLKLHADSGFGEEDIIFKQVVIPLSPIGETIFFKSRWYGKSTSFTIDKDELKIKPEPGQNERSREHLGAEEFDKEIHKKYLTHIDIKNLKGLKVEYIYKWKVGETLIVDRSHIHCSSSNIGNRKLGLTTFTKKK
ncbi:MAG: hypothetical protein CMI68_01715 [Candidatus Pelagibacter sp.]|jgi:hypothetical protein|nr:hypothetical protein [Candidatus Pelagibacter sp.]MDP6440968.1 hypothetical protein [Pelagibacteraceae bacterium]|tara:strand:+ start:2150 stop:2848 length:699 start_codon:yes stop_codon:yes gene_type:complete